MLMRQLSWMSLEQQSCETDHFDWLLKMVVVEEDLEWNQRFILDRKPLMHQTVVEEEVVEEAEPQADFCKLQKLSCDPRKPLSLFSSIMRCSKLLHTRLESPIGGSCSLAYLAFPPRLDLHPPDLLYSVVADQSDTLLFDRHRYGTVVENGLRVRELIRKAEITWSSFFIEDRVPAEQQVPQVSLRL
ncbi:hypothetical protein Tco_0218902 [Tanacetum coccineum]